jgi:3-hydroxybutyryl-CoA dehydrogenase
MRNFFGVDYKLRRCPMTFKKVFIVGSGLMGSGIAQVCAQAGISVILNDTKREAIENGFKNMAWSVSKLIEKGKLSEDKETILNRISTDNDFSNASDADLALEAVFEKFELKQHVFRRLDEVCQQNAIWASNTSAIPITELASATKRPEKVLGIHFFNPVPMMPVAEIIKGIGTAEETVLKCIDFVKHIGMEPIRVESDVAGFLLNRINFPSIIEAIRLVEQRIGTVADIDKGMRLAFGRKMGPFETGDMVGLDVTFGALMACYNETKNSRFYPPQLLRRKVKAGHLGRKTGKGWYEYNEDGSRKGV